MENQYEKIEAYIDGTLPAEERRDFEAKIAADPELGAEVKLHQRLQDTLSNEAEWRFRQTLNELRDSVDEQLTEEEKPSGNSSLKWLLPGILGLIIIASLTWYYMTPPPMPQLPETPEVPEAPREEISPAEETEPTVTAPEEEPPVAEEPEPEAPAVQPYAPIPELEQLAAASPLSNAYDFSLEATVRSGNPQTLIVEGELLSAQWDAETPLLLELYSNNPKRYPADPLLSGNMIATELQEDGPIAFAAKTAYFVNFEEDVDLPKGLYYYRVRLTGAEELLWVGKIRR